MRFGLVCALFLAGCSKPVATPEAVVVPVTEPSMETDSTPPEAPPPPESPLESEPEPAPAYFEKFVLFAPRGPLVVHLELLIDGQPQRTVAEHLLDETVESLTPAGRQLTWSELVANPRFTSGELGNVSPSNAAAARQMTTQYDINRNGRVERNELAACLAQDAAGGQLFALQSLGGSDDEDGAGSALFGMLDTDHDGRLSSSEIGGAGESLRRRDADEDDALTPGDLRAARGENPTMRRSTSTQAKDARELKKWAVDSIFYTFGDLYDRGGGLDATSLLSAALLKHLDSDGNGKVGQNEMQGLLTAPADLVLRVNFGGSAGEQPHELVHLQPLTDEFVAAGARAVASPDRLTLEVGHWGLDVLVVEAPMAAESPDKPRTYRSLVVQTRVGRAPDALFNWLDVNRDGRLSLREMQTAGERIGALDRDADGSVNASAIPGRMTLLIARGPIEPAGMPAGQSPREQKSTSKAPEWLSAMDQNGDGELSRREFLGTVDQFGHIDINEDGLIDAQEAQDLAESATTPDGER